MDHLSPKDRKAIQTALEAQRDNLLGILKAALEESGQTQYAEVLGRASGDSGDEALAVTLGDLSAARLDHELRAFQALEAARKRLNEADFGLCADCGDAIPAARLIANPAATRCVRCQEVYEHTHAGQNHGSL
jgi:DnaK suppressor protein